MKLINIARKVTRLFNIEVGEYPNSDAKRRALLFDYFKINKILDVGANKGQYAKSARTIGYSGQIISFEPLSSAYAILQKVASKDDKWNTFNIALGNTEETTSINISENSHSSSILDATQELKKSAPDADYMSTEEVVIKKLDNLYDELVSDGDIVMLKMDVQGFEAAVLEGAGKVLPSIKAIQIEMSLAELYQGEKLFFEMSNIITEMGFKLYSLENGFYNSKSGQLLQVDGIFFRD